MTSAAREPTRRLFFALWPDDAARRRLVALTNDLVPQGPGRPQRPDQWHLTLQFLGEVTETRLPAVLDAGAAASRGTWACDLEFDRLEHWKRPEVLCLAARSTPERLAGLVQALRAELLRRGFALEARPFKAHVTLARRIVKPPPAVAVQSLAWRVRELSLVESVSDRQGSRYVQLAAWPPRG